jgi:hypothetical protein
VDHWRVDLGRLRLEVVVKGTKSLGMAVDSGKRNPGAGVDWAPQGSTRLGQRYSGAVG